ncbi:hypothetical protein E5720_17570 [Rhodococcus sp. PAMC28707]|uniref:hypothetical protein n=1 Tax=unclassified Rhodococcus (in: high G+C Gram-positive bacteria) TaxID=192944 RepID=UPI00109E26EC|nr:MULTISPECIES: hypothetical protein [unclassified Rhodococcus (in: high G+C Gram-positive bacteria)]QCB51804.1 hypothetical protein E5769_17955 [Rhodococcus sp. PAMC28705]QCB60028.1 hypothetical protein E5720_17570 [Rhodococcus sp. PAMC28707]
METKPSSTTAHRTRRVIGIIALTVLFTIAAGGVAAAQAANPFDGVNPDIGLLGPALNSTWKRLLAAAWGVALAVTGFNVMTSFLSFKKAKSRGMPGDLSDASADLKLAGAGLAGTAAAGVIVGAILFLVQG